MNIYLLLNKEQQSIFGYWLRRSLPISAFDLSDQSYDGEAHSNESLDFFGWIMATATKNHFVKWKKSFRGLSGFDITLKYFMRDLRGIAGYLDLKAC
jgi:hypothetical protein